MKSNSTSNSSSSWACFRYVFVSLLVAGMFFNTTHFFRSSHNAGPGSPVAPVTPPSMHTPPVKLPIDPTSMPRAPPAMGPPAVLMAASEVPGPQTTTQRAAPAAAAADPPRPFTAPPPPPPLLPLGLPPVRLGPVASSPPSAPKKIRNTAQEFLPEYQPCCDSRPKGKRPGTPQGDGLMAAEDVFLAAHAAAYPFPAFSGVHKCFNNAEAYTASWLAHRDLVLKTKFEGAKYGQPYDKDSLFGYPTDFMTNKQLNMEAVTHSVLKMLINRESIGAFKTLDAFDFSIEHLSIYERRLGVMGMEGALQKRTIRAILENLGRREQGLRRVALARRAEVAAGGSGGLSPDGAAKAARTMVLMPFYGSAKGTGHSVTSTRFAYLNMTFWSHYRVFPHIGVVVSTAEDLAFVTSAQCGLPWAEVMSVEGLLMKPKQMGVASGLIAAQKFRNGQWSQYDYMYWTESDQVLVLREAALSALYALVGDGQHLVAPHRLLPFPRSEDFDPPLAAELKTTTPTGGGRALGRELRWNDDQALHVLPPSAPASVMAPLPDLGAASCCFDPGDCTRRDQWAHFSDHSKLCMLRFADTMGVVNGEANIFRHTWRTCAFSSPRQECPRPY